MDLKTAISLLWVFLLVSCGEKAERSPVSSLRGTAMGTSWTLAWRGGNVSDLQGRVETTLEHWEQVLSQWRAGSDVSRHNRGEPPSADLQRVISMAERFRDLTGGTFDHRILEKVHEAGFGPEGRGIDLSAIGKGFAVDQVGEMLRAAGVTDFIFELGGEVLAGDGEWQVDIEHPDPTARQTARVVMLKNQALATSGNYRQFRPSEGGLVSHLIDPRSGKPVIRPACSVTVIASDCATADAWATALFVLGPEYPEPSGLTVSWLFGEP